MVLRWRWDPCEASWICLHLLRNSPGVRGVPAPPEPPPPPPPRYYVITRPRDAAMLHCLGLGEESRVQQMSTRLFTLSRDGNLRRPRPHGRAHAPARGSVRVPNLYCWRRPCVWSACVRVRALCYDVNDNLTGGRRRGLAAPRALILKQMWPCLQSDPPLACAITHGEGGSAGNAQRTRTHTHTCELRA